MYQIIPNIKPETGWAKWISKWRGHRTLKSMVRDGGRQEKFLNFRSSKMTKTVTF